MKISIIILLLLFVIKITAQKAEINSNPDESISVVRLLDLNTSANPLTKGIESVSPFEIFKDTLYLIKRTKFLKIDLKTGKVINDSIISDFLEKINCKKSRCSQNNS